MNTLTMILVIVSEILFTYELQIVQIIFLYQKAHGSVKIVSFDVY